MTEFQQARFHLWQNNPTKLFMAVCGVTNPELNSQAQSNIKNMQTPGFEILGDTKLLYRIYNIYTWNNGNNGNNSSEL